MVRLACRQCTMKAHSTSLGSRLPARWKQQPPVSKVCWTMDPPGCRPAGVSENEAVLKEPGHIHSSSQAQTWPPLLCVCVCVCAQMLTCLHVYIHMCVPLRAPCGSSLQPQTISCLVWVSCVVGITLPLRKRRHGRGMHRTWWRGMQGKR